MDPWQFVQISVVELLYQVQPGINDKVSHPLVVTQADDI